VGCPSPLLGPVDKLFRQSQQAVNGSPMGSFPYGHAKRIHQRGSPPPGVQGESPSSHRSMEHRYRRHRPGYDDEKTSVS